MKSGGNKIAFTWCTLEVLAKDLISNFRFVILWELPVQIILHVNFLSPLQGLRTCAEDKNRFFLLKKVFIFFKKFICVKRHI